MANDDLGLADLSPNILDDWERWASDRPDRVTKQDANDRKILALVRAVRQLRAEIQPAPSTCACGLQSEVERFSPGHGSGMCLIAGKWVSRDDMAKPPREIMARWMEAEARHVAAAKDLEQTKADMGARVAESDKERAAEWRRAERWEAAATALARIVSGDDSSPDGAGLGQWGVFPRRQP